MMQSPAGLVMELRSQGWRWARWGKGRGLLWLETVRGTHPGRSETPAVISAGLGRERQLGLLGGGGWGLVGDRATAAHQPVSPGWTPPSATQFTRSLTVSSLSERSGPLGIEPEHQILILIAG